MLNLAAFALATPLAGANAASPPAWGGFAGNAQHTGQSATPPQAFGSIHWTAAVDAAPQLSGGELLIHYASPMITAANTVLLPVKGTATGGFRIEARAGATGALLWTLNTGWTPPAHNWYPPLPAVLSQQNRLSVAGPGGVVTTRLNPDLATGTVANSIFYGASAYSANKAAFNKGLQISTPLATDAAGNLYFGFTVSGTGLTDSTGKALKSGIARISASGVGTWVSATTASGLSSMTQVPTNAAPAVSKDGKTIYVPVSNGSSGYLLALNSTTLATNAKVSLVDPSSGWAGWVSNDSSASPMVGPDGDVYFGVLEQPFPNHNDRGWLLHYDAALATIKTPGPFGWDNTTSVVPASVVPSYTGPSSYLLMTKYNNYQGIGTGDGLNRIAIVDPGTAAPDQLLPAVQSMAVVQSVLGPTNYPGTSLVPGTSLYPRYEWCINSAAVDITKGTVIANSEDGHLYHWDLKTGLISESLLLNTPRPEAYTMTVIGPDGTVYAINNATFYAIGK